MPPPVLKPTNEDQLLEAVRGAVSDGTPVEVMGSGSKRAYGRPVSTAARLDLSALAGIVAYEPEELVVTVKAGTPLAELEAALAEKRQRLAFEPGDWGPLLGAEPGTATIGGVVACNLAGPRRVSQGAARDHVLGLKCVSGLGETFVCGGKVVKNVTGFDLPKLLTGSLGTLAVIHEVTLRVAPWPDGLRTITVSGLDDRAAIAVMTKGLSSPYEVSGAAHLGQITGLRLEGPEVSVAARAEALRHELAGFGEVGELDADQSTRFWTDVRDVTPFVGQTGLMWRLMVPATNAAAAVTAIAAAVPLRSVYDRGGSLVWLALEGDDPVADLVRTAAEAAGGQATLFRAPAAIRADVAPFHPQPAPLAALSQRIKAAFDPRNVLNPGRMTPVP